MPRAEGRNGSGPENPPLVRGTWWPLTWGDGRHTANICCRDCGWACCLFPDHHSIAQDGIINPSLVCPNDQCNFHEYVRLDGWEETHA